MTAYEDTRSIEVRAAAADCFSALTDYERLPEWQSRICECRVLETDEKGRGTLVEYAIDAILRKVRYTLRHRYDEPGWIGSEYVRGDFREFSGDYRLAPRDGGTEVTFRLRIDPGFRIPGRITRMLGPAVMGKSLRDLKNRVEGTA